MRIVQHPFVNQAMMRGRIIRIGFGIDLGIHIYLKANIPGKCFVCG